ncbi:MAG: SpoIIE family protein phosphatase [Clostridia bacterium]|nr:SpoIIE family protein phosphatase [Clostridia bacterium]
MKNKVGLNFKVVVSLIVILLITLAIVLSTVSMAQKEQLENQYKEVGNSVKESIEFYFYTDTLANTYGFSEVIKKVGELYDQNADIITEDNSEEYINAETLGAELVAKQKLCKYGLRQIFEVARDADIRIFILDKNRQRVCHVFELLQSDSNEDFLNINEYGKIEGVSNSLFSYLKGYESLVGNEIYISEKESLVFGFHITKEYLNKVGTEIGEEEALSQMLTANDNISPLEGDDYLVWLLIDFKMAVIEEEVSNYLIVFSIIILIVYIAIGILIMYIVRKMVISPITALKNASLQNIKIIAEEKDNHTLNITKLKYKYNDEIGELAESLNYLYDEIKKHVKNMEQVTIAEQKNKSELDIAAKIQNGLLPKEYLTGSNFDIFASMTPAKKVGGDFYDFYKIDDNNLAVLIADVSGKGIPASLFMTFGKTVIKENVKRENDLGILFGEINDILCRNNEQNLFITAFMGILNTKTGEFSYVNAGHEVPFIKQNNQYKKLDVETNFVLGGIEGYKYKAQKIILNPTDSIFLYTDGVVDALNKDNESFGNDRLLDCLENTKILTKQSQIKSIKETLSDFSKDVEAYDDITMLNLEYLGSGAMLRIEDSDESVTRTSDFIEEYLDKNNVSIADKSEVLIIIDEIVSNIHNYSTTKFISTEIDIKNGEIHLEFEDNGEAFDPTAKQDADTSLDAEDREIGGLGILITKRLSKSVEYNRIVNCNVLKVVKIIKN